MYLTLQSGLVTKFCAMHSAQTSVCVINRLSVLKLDLTCVQAALTQSCFEAGSSNDSCVLEPHQLSGCN